MHIDNIHLIHDDLILATRTMSEHIVAIGEIKEAMINAGLTLNLTKCKFGYNEIKFWDMIFSADGMRPDPDKIDAINFITAPTNKDDLFSFLCMMQSNSDFIPNFAQKAAPLRELTYHNIHFKWKPIHQKCFESVIQDFKKDMLLRYYDMRNKMFVITDPHITGLGAMLAQEDDLDSARLVIIASRTTSKSESIYLQFDLKATATDFALRRIRNYLFGAPQVLIITDNKPLCPIFNSHIKGSTRIDRIKLCHQDIYYTVQYQHGKVNQSDYLSRHGKPLPSLSEEEQKETDDLHNLLCLLHTTPIIDHLSISSRATCTKEDRVAENSQIKENMDSKILVYKIKKV